VPRWMRMIRGMLGMGLTFSVGVGVIASVIAVIPWLLSGGDRGLVRLVVASAIWAFPIGVAFSAVMALTARGSTFEKLSLPRFAALGAGAGLLLFGVLAANAWGAWSARQALANAGIFLVLGAGSATATLAIARRAGRALQPGDESRRLEEET